MKTAFWFQTILEILKKNNPLMVSRISEISYPTLHANRLHYASYFVFILSFVHLLVTNVITLAADILSYNWGLYLHVSTFIG